MCYKYEIGNKLLSLNWELAHTDASCLTGLTLFDFDQDGEAELVYRDETELRIIDGTPNGAIKYPNRRKNTQVFRNYSGTSAEYPVVADVDGDGQAEIIIVGGRTWEERYSSSLWVFKSGDPSGSPWAPARPVWNQYTYHPAYVNSDLSIPKFPISPATKFNGPDGNPGTSDDVQPFNNFLQQQTQIGRNGMPLWTLPRAEYNADPLYDYYPDGDSLRIHIDIINNGDASFHVPFYISVYKKGATETETWVKTDSIMQVIANGSTVQKVISIKDLSNLLPFDSLIVRLNDEGQGKYIQQECDTTGNRAGEARWKVMRVNTDLATVQKYYSVEIPVLNNDYLPASLFSGSFSLGDSVSIPPTAGTLTAVGSGALSKLVYTNYGNPLVNNIDSFQYKITFFNPELSANRTYSAWVYIYVLDDLNGAAGCYGQPHTVNLSARPTDTTFDWWYNASGTQLSPPDGSTRVVTNITADTTFQIRPNVLVSSLYHRLGGFPKGAFTIKLANTSGTVATMRWTGLADNLWHNPANWVAVRSMANGSMYETPVSYAPTKCVNVIIPSIVGNFPELVDSAWCNDILMEDRAMLKNPHVLTYHEAKVEIKLKPSERDRFVMWSAPLSGMFTGDYHYKSKAGEPQFGDFFMNFFQQSNPDNSGSAAAQGNFTTTFGSVNQPLQLGKAFNLRVVTTSLSRDSILRFSGETDTYNGIPLGSRPNKYKFVTQGVAQNALGRFNLPVYSGTGTTYPYNNDTWKLVQVVNPYMAYLRADSFLQYNPALKNGYYYWNGEPDGSFTTVGVAGTGNRFVYTEQSTVGLPNLIAPLQSFFVAKTNQNSQVSAVVMSPRWTTASPPASYTLRSTQVTSGGVLYIRAIQGSRTSSTALVYDPEATSKADLPVLVYNEIPLTLYAFSPGREALSIRTSNDFQSRATDLGLRVMNAGEMKLEFSGLSTFGHDVYLQDRQLGKTVNLQNNPVYTFTVAKPGADAIELNDRFSLEMTYTGKGIVTGSESTPSISTLQVSSKDGYLNVQSQGGKIDRLQVYSLTGSLIYSSNSSSGRFNIPLPGGVYIVKGLIGATYYTEKAVVR
ncbi:hypothetical protein FACS189411_02780 [Bacteroidia bacterium]|nr:hypothetical protein FACS189411_02780 [Bacteroidia bacterium]